MNPIPTSTADLSLSNDLFCFHDKAGRKIFEAPLSPQLTTLRNGESVTSPYHLDSSEQTDDALHFRWSREDGNASLEWTWRILPDAIMAEPLLFSCTDAESVESITFFATRAPNGNKICPAGQAHRRIVPGIAMGPEISPIQHKFNGIDGTFSLGRGRGPSIHQQWALPTHFFCVHSHGELGSRNCISNKTSDTLCIGLLDFPVGDVELVLYHHNCALRFNRFEQCHPSVQPEPCQRRALTPPLAFTVDKDSRAAMRRYFALSVDTFHQGTLPASTGSPAKRAAAFATQTNTWGTEVSREHKRFTSDSLRQFYHELCQPNDGVDMFVIDDKWESTYGHLTHCPKRLPDFTDILDEIRADGRLVGMWAAFLRCENPESVGLSPAHMLLRPDGTPFHKSNEEGYYLYDVTQPEVRRVLQDLVRAFARRYRPDLIKFDFGYEIPTMDIAQPSDPAFAGDRFLQAALDLIVGTLREELPDIVVMYYGLSPLMLGLCDTHGPDDLFMAPGDYAMETNRRFYFASICAEFGMPLYSSGAYDWKSLPSIWFDALASGTLGSLADPACDETGNPMPARLIELRNQLKPLIGNWTQCRIECVGAQETGPLSGCTATGWLRYENDKLVFAALRPRQWDGLEPAPVIEGLEVNAPTIFASNDGSDIRTSSNITKIIF